MTKYTVFLLLILISARSFAGIGSNNNYWIISQTEYEERISKGKDVVLRRYIVVPCVDKKYKDIFETEDKKALLAKFSYMLLKNKSSLMDKYIAGCNTSSDIHYLIKGLYCFSKKQYSQAIAHLEKSEHSEYSFLKLLLIADCKYEMLQNKKNIRTILDAYQVALDCTENEQNKSLINNRIKYIKYM